MPSSPTFLCRCVWVRSVLACMGLLLAVPWSATASELRHTAIVRAYQEARPSVVNIHGRKELRTETDQLALSSETGRSVNGMGTGIIIDERGYILTNYHVVEEVRRIQVTMADDVTLIARLINYDPKTDLAIIKIDSEKPLQVIKIGTSVDLMQGEPVIAIGNAYGYENTLTRGIISALHRTVQVSDDQKYFDLIQTDASINPGNSGGPLMNIDGEMIGINVAVRIGAQGIGFAIPVDEVMEIAAQLLSAERLNGVAHGITGKTVRDEDNVRFVVTDVRAESPCEQAGIQANDVLVQVAGRPIQRALDLERALLDHQAGEEVEFKIERESEDQEMKLTLDRLPRGQQSIEDRGWELLGMRLAPLNTASFRQHKSRYRGGLKVVAVRPDSPASKQGIQRGDVLVGMHIWETLSLENITYILNRVELEQVQPVKFYILRGNETLYGYVRLALNETNAALER